MEQHWTLNYPANKNYRREQREAFVGVKHIAQEHTTVTPARAQTQTARPEARVLTITPPRLPHISWLVTFFCLRTVLCATAPGRPPPLATRTLEFSFGLSAGQERTRMSRTILTANQILVLMDTFCHVTPVLRPAAPVWRVWTMFMKLKRASPPMVRKTV